MKLFIIVLAVILFWMWAIHPRLSGKRRRNCRMLASWNYAHRGLWSKREGIPENSMAAFQRAADAGYGIELDVHMTADGNLVVFHDDTLRRMCGIEGRIADRTIEELQDLRLAGTGQGIPLLSSVLEMIDGRVPLLIELKMPDRDISMCRVVCALLETYGGEYLIQSFNPFGVRWIRRRYPEILVGQLAARYKKTDQKSFLLRFLSSALFMNTISRPDFVSYDCLHTDVLGFQINWRLFRVPVFVWVVQSEEVYVHDSQLYDGIIFENIRPAARRSGRAEMRSDEKTTGVV